MTRVSKSEWEWFGCPGHFICSFDCRFHLCTRVGNFLVSTVGEMFPDAPVREIFARTRGIALTGMGDERKNDYMKKIGFDDIGYKRKYETMVFRINDKRCEVPDCGCGLPGVSFSELDCDGYNTAGEATNGHMKICEKWANEEEIKCQMKS